MFDSRRYHRHAAPERVRHFGKNESSTSISSPYGGLPMTTAGAISRQQIQPLLQGLGLGVGKKAQRIQSQIESGQARGPLANAIRSIQQFAPSVINQGRDVGEQQATQGAAAVGGLQDYIRQAQAALPQYQAAANTALGGSQEALNAARGALTGPAVTGSQDALARAQELLRGGAAQGGAESALSLAQRYANQAASPIAGEDLYQQAARRVMQQVQPGLAARGLEAGGAGAQAQAETMRDLAYKFAADQAANRQATLQGLGGATANLSGIQQGAVSGVGQQAGNVANIQQQGISGLGQAAGNVGQAAQNAQGMSTAGVGLAGQNVGAVQQLGQFLQSRYGIPMQASGSLLNLLTAGVSPGLQSLEAQRPIATPSSKGMQVL